MRKIISLIFLIVLLFVNTYSYAETGTLISTGAKIIETSTGMINSTGNLLNGTGVLDSSVTVDQIPTSTGGIDTAQNVVSTGSIENLTFQYYYGQGCSHCAKVDEYMNAVDGFNKLNIVPKEIYQNDANRSEYLAAGERLGLKEADMGIPFLLVNDSGKETYMVGDESIINFFKQYLGEAPETSKKGVVLAILLIMAIVIPVFLIKLSNKN